MKTFKQKMKNENVIKITIPTYVHNIIMNDY